MKIFYPKNTLRVAMEAADPLLANTALGRAETGIASIKAECLSHMDALIARLVELDRSRDASSAKLMLAYEAARRMIGLGAVTGYPQIDHAASGLCDVADGLMSRGSEVWAPIAAHIDALNLMRQHELPAVAVQQLLTSLETLKHKFAQAAATDSARA